MNHAAWLTIAALLTLATDPKAEPAAPDTAPASRTVPRPVMRTDWIEPARRTTPDLRVPAVNQDGARLDLANLVDRPTAAAFFYTRCGNLRKCPVTVGRMAELQRMTGDAGLEGKVRLLLLTYEPELDTPPILRTYGVAHGVRPSATVMLLAPPSEQKSALLERLNVAVNFDDGARVNAHGLELFLFDGRRGLARKYHTLIWDNALVLDDLRRLAAEVPPDPQP